MNIIPTRYNILHNQSNGLLKAIEDWVIAHDSRNDSYHRAKNLWEAIMLKAYKDSSFCLHCVMFFQHLTTGQLKKLLAVTDYDDSNLVDFNALSLLDTCSTKINQ